MNVGAVAVRRGCFRADFFYGLLRADGRLPTEMSS